MNHIIPSGAKNPGKLRFFAPLRMNVYNGFTAPSDEGFDPGRLSQYLIHEGGAIKPPHLRVA
jgi:hypothetical protein